MNFLSHFYFTQAIDNPYYTLGSILPDLFKNYQNSWKFHPENLNVPFNDNPNLDLLYQGWNLHIKVDALFHNSAPFKLQSSALRKELVNVFTSLPKRPFFLAHIGYELILDSLLIQNKVIDIDLFYRNLSSCNPVIVDSFMNKLGITEYRGFHSFLKNFIQSGYLKSYDKTESLVHALDRIGRRVWIEEFTDSESANTIKVFDEVILDLAPIYLDIFNLLEEKIKNEHDSNNLAMGS